MNRHGKFYAELAAELAEEDEDYYDEEDYYYEDEEDYYYEEGVEYDEEGGGKEGNQTTPSSTAAPTKNPFSTISPQQDEDYDVLAVMIPRLDTLWKESDAGGIPLLESEAVEGLRANEYDPSATAAFLKAQRQAKRNASAGHRSLKVVSSTAVAKSSDVNAEVLEGGDEGKKATSHTTASSRKASSPFSGSPFMSPSSPLSGKFTCDCTFVITGHVDAGKSTILGHLLLLLGKVPEMSSPRRADSPMPFAWLLDQSEEERRRGVTIDAGTFSFETDHRKVHVLDAPGHKEYVLSMISSATQADAALLIVTATHGEFEAGLAHGTKEHLRVLDTLGVGSIIIAVNKMDAVEFSQDRFDHVVREVKLLFKQLQISEARIAGICPISGTDGTNLLKTRPDLVPWYTGPSLIELMDTCPLESRLVTAPLRISVQDVQQNVLYAKVESGRLKKGATVQFLPCDLSVNVKSITKSTGGAVGEALAGEQVEIVARSTPVGLYPGCVGCERKTLIQVSTDFEARIQTFENLARPILPGTSFVMIAHALNVTVRVVALVSKLDGKGNWSKGMVKCIPANTQAIVIFRTENKVALDPAQSCRALGRFVFSQEGDTVAGGLIERVLTV